MYRVAIADDEEFIRAGILARIEESRMPLQVVGTAGSGLQAVQLYRETKPELFFVDIRMPGMDGLAFIEHVRKEDPGCSTRFIIISGYDDFPYMQKALRMGVSDYLKKPIQQEEFEGMLRTACEAIDRERSRPFGEAISRNYWDDFCRGRTGEEAGGTFLLVFRPGLRHFEAMEDLMKICPPEQWKILCFHEVENAVLLYGYGTRLEEGDQICRRLNAHVVSAFGTDLLPDEMLARMEAAMNLRFVHRLPFFCRAEDVPLQETDTSFLPELRAAIENVREERFRSLIPSVFRNVFSSEESVPAAGQIFQICVTEIADSYIRHGRPIPPDVRRALLPMALTGYQDEEELADGLCALAEKLNAVLAEMDRKKDITGKISQYIQDHYIENLTLTSIADEFFLAPTYLSKRFKEKTGKTVMQYLEEIRMERAMEMLRSSDRSISDIAASVGYNDSNYFARTFRKTTGVTPREYRGKGNLPSD